MTQKSEIVITHAVRTPIGSLNGALSAVPAHQLGAETCKALLNKSKIPASAISQVIMGQVLTASCGQNPARQASILAGIPHETPAFTINQVCGSGLLAIKLAYQEILTNNVKVIIAGGQENMSLSPHTIHIRNGQKMGNTELQDSMIHDGLWDIFNNYHMGLTAENIAEQFNINKNQQDEFALNSQQKTKAAIERGRFNDEIIPINYTHRRKEITVDTDEFPRPETTLESLQKLRPAFKKEGTVTAGNASGLNDGAAAVLIMKKETADEYGLTPLATIISTGQAGVNPEIMGTGPVPATLQALENAQWTTDDLDLIEANEAFASQATYVNNTLKWDTSKVNVNGGSIALGHPIGASGARIVVTLLHEMHKRQAQKGLATLCVGGGMGIAMCFENN